MILYIGNKLSRHGKSMSVIETLVPKLESRYDIKSASDKKNIFLRFLDMFFLLIRHKNETNVVLIDAYSTLSFYYVLMASSVCRLFNIPYIPIVHGGNFKQRLLKNPKITSMVFIHASVIISPSYYLQKVFADQGYETLYIPNSVVLSELNFTLRDEIAPKLIWVRSFLEMYNPFMAVKVLKILTTRYPNSELCMVGGGDVGLISNIKKWALDEGVMDNIVITGKLSREDWFVLSKNYNIFINTTNVDNQPISILEAMALGLPIVSTNAGGIPFLIDNENDGILIDCNNPEQMAEKIFLLLTDTVKVETLSRNARAKAMTFDWGNVREKWFALLDKYSQSKTMRSKK